MRTCENCNWVKNERPDKWCELNNEMNVILGTCDMWLQLEDEQEIVLGSGSSVDNLDLKINL